MAQEDSMSALEGSRRSYRSNWQARNFLLSGVFIGLAVALVWQGVIYIGEGIGGLVPYLMIVLGPSLAVFYIWYLLFRVPEVDTN
jgi:hypothetical protein